MNKYRICWYAGNVIEIKEILEEKTIRAKNIDNAVKAAIKYFKPKVFQKIYYCRVIYVRDEGNEIRSVDYGSYSKFFWIEKV